MDWRGDGEALQLVSAGEALGDAVLEEAARTARNGFRSQTGLVTGVLVGNPEPSPHS